jgi:hypothetical protein
MRSFNCVSPAVRAQWTQQKIWPSASTPCPTIRQLQCGQTGASAWIAHSKLSKVWCVPSTTTSNALSYSFSQTSHVAIYKSFARREVRGGVCLISPAKNVGERRCRCCLGEFRLGFVEADSFPYSHSFVSRLEMHQESDSLPRGRL